MTKLQINLSDAEQASLATYIETARKLLAVLETFNASDSEYAQPWAQAIQDRAYKPGKYTNLVGWGFKHVLSALKCMGADSVVGETWPEVSDEDLTLCYLATMLSEGEREALYARIPGWDYVEPVEIPRKLSEMFKHYAEKELPVDVWADPNEDAASPTWDGQLTSLRNHSSRRMAIPHKIRVLASRFVCIKQCWAAAEQAWRDSGACWGDLPSRYQSLLTKLGAEQNGELGYYDCHEDTIIEAIEKTVRELPTLLKWSEVSECDPGFGREMDSRIDDLEELAWAYHVNIRVYWDHFVGDVQFERDMAMNVQQIKQMKDDIKRMKGGA